MPGVRPAHPAGRARQGLCGHGTDPPLARPGDRSQPIRRHPGRPDERPRETTIERTSGTFGTSRRIPIHFLARPPDNRDEARRCADRVLPFSCAMEMSMVPRPRSRACWLHCALIAMTIHAMAPDTWDVTSGSITMDPPVHRERPGPDDGRRFPAGQRCERREARRGLHPRLFRHPSGRTRSRPLAEPPPTNPPHGPHARFKPRTPRLPPRVRGPRPSARLPRPLHLLTTPMRRGPAREGGASSFRSTRADRPLPDARDDPPFAGRPRPRRTPSRVAIPAPTGSAPEPDPHRRRFYS